MVNTVIFDFGNVLGTFDKKTPCERYAKYAGGFSADEIYRQLVGSVLEKDLECGLINGLTFAERLTGDFKMTGITSDEILKIWGDIFSPNPGMPELLGELRGSGMKLALLSNTNEIHWPYMQKVPAVALLESWGIPLTLSYRVKQVKPHLEIYQRAIKSVQCLPEEAVYVDDVAEYVKAAEEVGMRGIQYDCTKQSAGELREKFASFLA